MDMDSGTIDRIEPRQPPHYVKARARTAVDIGSRFVACLVLGLLLSGIVSISQAMCSYSKLTVSQVAAAEPSFQAPAPVATSMDTVVRATGDIAEPIPCARLAGLAHPRLASL